MYLEKVEQARRNIRYIYFLCHGSEFLHYLVAPPPPPPPQTFSSLYDAKKSKLMETFKTHSQVLLVTNATNISSLSSILRITFST